MFWDIVGLLCSSSFGNIMRNGQVDPLTGTRGCLVELDIDQSQSFIFSFNLQSWVGVVSGIHQEKLVRDS